jgi:hypothetical protein
MEWTISFLLDERIVVIKTQGIADETSSFEMAKSIPKAMIEYKTIRCLIDHSAIKSVSGNASEIYNRPKKFLKIGIPFKVKIAEVVLPVYKEHFDFLETVCRNRGFDFRTFDDQESAIQWLTK